MHTSTKRKIRKGNSNISDMKQQWKEIHNSTKAEKLSQWAFCKFICSFSNYNTHCWRERMVHYQVYSHQASWNDFLVKIMTSSASFSLTRRRFYGIIQ